MATWNSRGLRGSTLEDLINHTNEFYLEQGLALVQKIPTPITPVEFDSSTRRITLAYFDQRSTVDYIGVVQGYAVCFDAKECASDSFPLANIHEHQIEFMKQFEKQGGIAFFLIHFTERREFYYLRYVDLLPFLDRRDRGGLKHFKVSELSKEWMVPLERESRLLYLEPLAKDLEERPEN